MAYMASKAATTWQTVPVQTQADRSLGKPITTATTITYTINAVLDPDSRPPVPELIARPLSSAGAELWPSLRQQERDVLDYLADATHGALIGAPSPSLLPTTPARPATVPTILPLTASSFTPGERIPLTFSHGQ